MKTAFAEGTLY